MAIGGIGAAAAVNNTTTALSQAVQQEQVASAALSQVQQAPDQTGQTQQVTPSEEGAGDNDGGGSPEGHRGQEIDITA